MQNKLTRMNVSPSLRVHSYEVYYIKLNRSFFFVNVFNYRKRILVGDAPICFHQS